MTSPLDAFDVLPVAAFAVDAAGKITHWNAAAAALTGRSAAQVRGKKTAAALDGGKKTTPVDEALIRDEPATIAYELRVESGDRVAVTLVVEPLHDASGELIGASAVVSPRPSPTIRADDAVSRLATAVMWVDRDLEVLALNPAATALLGEVGVLAAAAQVGGSLDGLFPEVAQLRAARMDPGLLPVRATLHEAGRAISLRVDGCFGEDGGLLGFVLEWADVTGPTRDRNEAVALRGMLENAQACVMMSDADGVITHVNPALQDMFRRYEDELSFRFPTFSVSGLVGQPVDMFHADPERHRAIMSDPYAMPHRAMVAVGEMEFDICITMLQDADGQHVGNAVEWTDQTPRARFREQMDALYASFTQGALSFRGDLEALDEVYRPMLHNFHEIIEAIVAPIQEIRACLARVSEGDLTAYVTGTYLGDHALLRDALNQTLDSLNDILGKVRSSADQIATGSSELSGSAQGLVTTPVSISATGASTTYAS